MAAFTQQHWALQPFLQELSRAVACRAALPDAVQVPSAWHTAKPHSEHQRSCGGRMPQPHLEPPAHSSVPVVWLLCVKLPNNLCSCSLQRLACFQRLAVHCRPRIAALLVAIRLAGWTRSLGVLLATSVISVASRLALVHRHCLLASLFRCAAVGISALGPILLSCAAVGLSALGPVLLAASISRLLSLSWARCDPLPADLAQHDLSALPGSSGGGGEGLPGSLQPPPRAHVVV